MMNVHGKIVVREQCHPQTMTFNPMETKTTESIVHDKSFITQSKVDNIFTISY